MSWTERLFFRKPHEILRWLDEPLARRNRWNVARVDRNTRSQRSGRELHPPDGFNSGMGLVTRDSMRFERVEK